jgi:branched-chain amino acid transport system permease protein
LRSDGHRGAVPLTVAAPLRRLRAAGPRRARLPVLLVLLAVPVLLPSAHVASVARSAATFGVLALGYAVVLGLCGQFTMAHAALFGVGAYATGILAATVGVDPWLTLPAAIVLAALAGALLGLAALRVGGDLLAVVTLAAGQLAQLVFVGWTPVTGGNAGIPDVPALHLGGRLLIDEHQLYVVAALVLVAAVVCLDRIKRSRLGLAMQSVREDELLAAANGVHVGGHKVVAFALSGAFAGAAGWLEATAIGAVSPTTYDVVLSVLVAVMVLLAGAGRVYAVLAGAAFVAVLQDLLSGFPLVETGCIGAAIVAVVMWRSGVFARRWRPAL